MSDRHPDEPCQGETAKATVVMERLATLHKFVCGF